MEGTGKISSYAGAVQKRTTCNPKLRQTILANCEIDGLACGPSFAEEMPTEAADFPEADFPAPIRPTFLDTRRNRSTLKAAKT